MTAAILCSGQGPQHPGMFALTGECPEAAELFAHASTLLGGDPRALVRTEAPETIHKNRTGQILCCLQTLAAASALRGALSEGAIVAGYSVGEVAAWGVAGLFAMTDTLDLVASRAEAMDAAAGPDEGMLFVRGLKRDAVARLCEGREAAVAIVNPDDAFVLGGSRQALAALAEKAKALNASRIVELPIDVASHTSLIAEASAVFRSSTGLGRRQVGAERGHASVERKSMALQSSRSTPDWTSWPRRYRIPSSGPIAFRVAWKAERAPFSSSVLAGRSRRWRTTLTPTFQQGASRNLKRLMAWWRGSQMSESGE